MTDEECEALLDVLAWDAWRALWLGRWEWGDDPYALRSDVTLGRVRSSSGRPVRVAV